MKRSQRRTATKVVNGRVQHKNRWSTGNGYANTSRCEIERRRAGYDYRHIVTRDEVYRFIQLIPEWEKHAKGLERIVLDAGSKTLSGWFRRGVIAICAMPKDRCVEFDGEFFYRDVDFFDRFGVPYEWNRDEHGRKDGTVDVQFNSWTGKYYLLMRTLLHELGHHLDLISNPKQWCSRGEDFAESVGRRLEHRMYGVYVRSFGHPHRNAR